MKSDSILRLLGAVLPVLFFVSCDFNELLVTPVTDAVRIPTGLALSVTPMQQIAGAVQQVGDSIWIHVSDGTDALADTTIAQPPAETEVRLQLLVELKQQTDSVTVTLELRSGIIPIARTISRETVEAGRVNAVVVDPRPTSHPIAVGRHHTCGLGQDGATYCWGDNTNGQLGDPTRPWVGEPVPGRVTGAVSFQTIAAGGDFTCGLAADGAAYCWGENGTGQLGTGSIGGTWGNAEPQPVAVAGGLRFASVAAGGPDIGKNHVCGLTGEGGTYCWGSNSAGQLGNASTASASSPVQVASSRRFSAIDAGHRFTCALDEEGRAFCWGANESGQLGDDSRQERRIPTEVASEARFVTIAAGWDHACAIDQAGALYCWGSNDGGELGIGAWGGTRESPVRVASSETFSAVSAGVDATCALSADGVRHCWGGNWLGARLGNGTHAAVNTPEPLDPEMRYRAIDVGSMSHGCAITVGGEARCWGDTSRGGVGNGDVRYDAVPFRIAVSETMIAIARGHLHACGISVAAEAWCWGTNHRGQLGAGAAFQDSDPHPVAGGIRFSSIDAGDAHTCGIDDGGGLYCWGDNTHGQLGIGSPEHQYTPVAVLGGETVEQVAVGWFHTCALAAGDIYCFGLNDWGQLGDGSTTDSPTPVRAAGGIEFASVAVGTYFTCAVAVSGDSYCWGDNRHGQHGSGTTTPSLAPVLVAGGHSFRQLSLDGHVWGDQPSHACGVTTSDEILCWGRSNGSLQPQPVGAPAVTEFTRVFAAWNHVCALTTQANTYCWGWNGSGELGVGHNGDVWGSWTTDNGGNTPLRTLAPPLVDLSTGPSTCGVDTSGAVLCWGDTLIDLPGDDRVRFVLSPAPVLGGIRFR
jgi:alpha-tubulin suppressor-like RCC1 family protein